MDVWVLVREDRDGWDITAYQSYSDAVAALADYVRDNWMVYFYTELPLDDDVMIERYYADTDEMYEIANCQIAIPV